MFSRNIRIALGISILLHMFLMSAVVIVPPKSLGRNKAFTEVEFLGPILEKTAFDIMLETAVPVKRTTYSLDGRAMVGDSLRAASPGKIVFTGMSSLKTSSSIDVIGVGFLTVGKTVPNFLLDMGSAGPSLKKDSVGERKVISVPEEPIIEAGRYGDKTEFRILMRVLVNAEGNVKAAESTTTTGYPEVDIIASNFVKGWTFQPKESIYGKDEWITREVVIKTKGEAR